MYLTTLDSHVFPINPPTYKRSLSPSRKRGPLKKRKVVIQKRPSVRFNDDTEVHKPRVFKTPLLPSSTWLKEKDFHRIRDNVFSTIDAMKRKRDTGFRWSDITRRNHCSRGLEDFNLDQKGSLKASTVHRRQNAIRAVLHEQEVQLNCHRRLQSALPKHERTFIVRHEFVLDHAKLSRIYIKQTGFNIHEAIHKGRLDSYQAMAIYSERPLQAKSQAQSGHRRRLLLPSKLRAKNRETTWGFASTPMPVKPNRCHRRIVSIP